jgi:hypothetical protein
MEHRRTDTRDPVRSTLPTIALVATVIVGSSAALSLIGGDAAWLAALGRAVADLGRIPSGVPYAAAPSAHWPNAIVLAELIFHWLYEVGGARALMLAQLIAVAAAVVTLGIDAARYGAGRRGIAFALIAMWIGAMLSLSVVRVQLFSLFLFPVLLALLRAETRRPSTRIWLAVPLLGVWSNLHGAALVGLLVLLVYLAVERGRRQPLLAGAIGTAAAAAMCLTPAGADTLSYYHGILVSQAVTSGSGLWAPLDLGSVHDLLLIAAAVAMAWGVTMCRWEQVVAVALALLSADASRSGIWLLFVLVAPAAAKLRDGAGRGRLLTACATVAGVALALSLIRGPLPNGAGRPLIDRALALAHGHPILADEQVAEQIALAGGTVWIANPLDAFSPRDQRAYIAWLDGKPGSLRPYGNIRVVLSAHGSDSSRLMDASPSFKLAGSDGRVSLYLRPAP